ncbi:MAG TPA: hypothetical protein VG847_07020 [Chitinophagaceae bacterium]|nr:hypothetical protein [Chitinophagaceae bacterium]
MAGIDRDYWLDFAKDSVSKSIQARDDAAKSIDTFLSWLWTIYTSVFVLASLLDYLSGDLAQVTIVAQPILIIMISRYFCLLVVMPVSREEAKADPNVVPEIIDSFQIIVDEKKKRLQTAKAATLISIISLCIALVGYNALDPNKNLKAAIQKAKLEKTLNDNATKQPAATQAFVDSMKIQNDSLDMLYQHTLKKKIIECLTTNNAACIDSLKKLEK